jgi:hypothetical protein
VDLVNCAQLRISRCCRLVPIKATDRGGGGDTAVTAGILIGEEICDIRPLVGLFLNGAIEVHTTSIGTDW